MADGSNASLSFKPDTGSGAVASLVRVRVRKLDYDWNVIATESHGRIHKAFYPRQRAVGQFALTLELKGYREFKPFADFMLAYIRTFMGANRKSMFISMPVRNFARYGIPVSGVYDGDHVGSMVFTPTIVFEGMHDPLDPNILTTSPNLASWDFAGATGDQAKFFYPFSEGSRDSSVKPETLYDINPTTAGLSGITGALENALGNASDVFGAGADSLARYQDDVTRTGQ